jgi:hypothetical protein
MAMDVIPEEIRKIEDINSAESFSMLILVDKQRRKASPYLKRTSWKSIS